MKFENDLYQKVYSEYEIEKAHNESKKDLVKRVYDNFKNFVINYTPFVGYLPVKTQNNKKDLSGKLFSLLNTKTATLASAVGLGLGAYFIGIHLDGFDIGFEMAQKIQFGDWMAGEAGEIVRHVSFPFIWGGFSKTVTQIASYYLIAESAVRTVANLVGKPLGCLIGEAAIYFMDKKSKTSKVMQEREEKLLRDEEQARSAHVFTEKERKEYEDNIASISQQIWEAKTCSDKKREENLKSLLDEILKKEQVV